MLDRIDSYLAPNLKALNLRAFRSGVIAGNIANADTPHYKARDIDFRAAMAGAVQNADLRIARTDAAHLDPKELAAGTPRLQYRTPVQSSIDGNTVEMDAEVGRFSDNAMRYQAALTFTNSRIRTLLTAIQGQ
ncbi:MAG: flagellar basal body rod protein FlgB [Burkholderiales bacterium]|nr:flagellar basal body rod protein FlgB [Burkholderiales bacterium]